MAIHFRLYCTVMFTWRNRQELVRFKPTGIFPDATQLTWLQNKEINGELATRFERICGNKGYSYDALEFNYLMGEYFKQYSAKTNGTAAMADQSKAIKNDLINFRYPTYNRGRVPYSVMREIGLHDCDWISLEENWTIWEVVASFAATIPLKLELHLPCREPLNHLMSQCNYLERRFDCNSTSFVEEVNNCLIEMWRFDEELKRMKNVHLRCFNPIPIDSYMNYLSGILQPRRISMNYVHRDTNYPRDKDKECIWRHPQIAEEVYAILLKMPFYRFCDQCMGSPDDLLA
jgi:hypothetical protein